MSIRLVTDKENVDYQAVADILDHFGLSHFDAATEEKIFKNSYATAFIYDGDQVVGCEGNFRWRVSGCNLQCGTSGRRLSFW